MENDQFKYNDKNEGNLNLIIKGELCESNGDSSKSENSSNSIIIDEHYSQSNESDKNKDANEINNSKNKNEIITHKKNDLLPLKNDKNNTNEFCKIIGEHQYKLEFIKELNNGYYIIGGNNSTLIIYDTQFNKLFEINGFNNLVRDVYEISVPGQKLEEIQLMCFSEETFLLVINTQTKTIKKTKIRIFLELKNIYCCMIISSNNYLFCSA